MRMLVVGDFHGKFSEKLKGKLRKEEFDLVLALGDYAGVDEWRPYIKAMFKGIQKGEVVKAEEFFGKARYKKLVKKDEERAKFVLRELDKLGKPIVGIFGNNDDEWYDYPFFKGLRVKKSRARFLKSLKNFRFIDYSTLKHNGFSFLGFGGYMDVLANHKKRMLNEREVASFERASIRSYLSGVKLFSLARKLKGKKVFVFHYPPKGVFDIIHEKGNPFYGKSAGIEVFREAILKHKPLVVFCGHMHEYQGVKKIGKTLVVNPGDAGKNRYAVVEIIDNKVKVKFSE